LGWSWSRHGRCTLGCIGRETAQRQDTGR
jgi:hypothetical protein